MSRQLHQIDSIVRLLLSRTEHTKGSKYKVNDVIACQSQTPLFPIWKGPHKNTEYQLPGWGLRNEEAQGVCFLQNTISSS